MTFKCISIEDTKKLLEKDNVTIIDIRDFNSFSQGHVNNAMHVEDINIELFLKEKDKEEKSQVLSYPYSEPNPEGRKGKKRKRKD